MIRVNNITIATPAHRQFLPGKTLFVRTLLVWFGMTSSHLYCKTTQMRPNRSRAILIFLITPTTTWLLTGYPYTTGTQKAAKISNKNFFNWVHLLHTELMNATHSTNLFTNSCDFISTNGKAPLHSHINHNNPQFLYSLWWRANAKSFTVVIQSLSTRLIKPNFC